MTILTKPDLHKLVRNPCGLIFVVEPQGSCLCCHNLAVGAARGGHECSAPKDFSFGRIGAETHNAKAPLANEEGSNVCFIFPTLLQDYP